VNSETLVCEDDMANTARRIIGLTSAILGMGLLILIAADYVMKLNHGTSGIMAIAIMLVVVGLGLTRRTKGERVERKTL